MVYDGIGDLSGDLGSMDNRFTSTAFILTFSFICRSTNCEVFLSLFFQFSTRNHQIKFSKVFSHSNSLHKQCSNTLKEQVITWPEEHDQIAQNTHLTTKGFLLDNRDQRTFNITIDALTYSGLFSSHAKDSGGKISPVL